jgi:adsorption protein B
MWSDWIAILVFATQFLLAGCGIVFFVSGIDDLFIDISYVIWRKRARLSPCAVHPSGPEGRLSVLAEQAVAIMIPAWHEAAVIRPMLTNTLRTVAYTNYHIFVGTYPNDPETQSEVGKVSAEFPNVHRVVCENAGPTCKADCLNWIFQSIRRYETEHHTVFSIVLMQDCEDCVHPLCLKVFNDLVPQYDMVQLPVFPLVEQSNLFTSGHYIDEFAEYHGKDIFIRALLSRAIPAAGVGCAFSRNALTRLADNNNKELFNTSSLTEDYEFGLRLGSLGMRSVFLNQFMPHFTAKDDAWRPRDRADRWIAVREYFPSTFKAAVIQKARWVVGIAIQGWRNIGWKGNLAMRYMLFRDRKAIVTNQVSLLGYAIVVFVVSFQMYTWLVPDSYRYPPLVERGSWLWNLLLVNLGFLGNRLGWRFYCVRRIYGYKQAFLALPRQIWANLINGCATNRAIYLFARSTILRRKIAWDKTAHVLPSPISIGTYRRRIGELLIEQGLISNEQLQQALAVQERFAAPIGFILVSVGCIRDRELIPALAQQLGCPWSDLEPETTPPEVVSLISRRSAIRYSIYPVKVLADGEVLFAAAEFPDEAKRREIQALTGHRIQLCLVTRGDLAVALRYRYASAENQSKWSSAALRDSYRRLGDVLMEQRAISSPALKHGVERFDPDSGTPFGEFLVMKGYITNAALRSALERQQTMLPVESEHEYSPLQATA